MKLEKEKKQKNVNDVVKVQDLGLACCLCTAQKKLIRLDKSNPKKVQFVFEKDRDIELAIEDYWDGSAQYSVRSFYENLKILKQRIYSDF